MANYTTPSKLQ